MRVHHLNCIYSSPVGAATFDVGRRREHDDRSFPRTRRGEA
jgi:hypothetical protein